MAGPVQDALHVKCLRMYTAIFYVYVDVHATKSHSDVERGMLPEIGTNFYGSRDVFISYYRCCFMLSCGVVHDQWLSNYLIIFEVENVLEKRFSFVFALLQFGF